VISQLLGCTFDALTLEGLLANLDPTSPKIAAWLDGATPTSVRDGFLRALLGNVDLIVTHVFKARDNPAAAAEDEDLWKKAQSPLALQDLAAYVESMNDFSRFAGRPYYEIQGDLDALVRQHGEFAPWYATLSQDYVPSMRSLSRAIAKSEAQMSMAKLSLELERYRGRIGAYPGSLDALGIPPLLDPFTGQPFAYRVEGGRFVLQTPGSPTGKEAMTWRSRN
jgi:hypothetical protein